MAQTIDVPTKRKILSYRYVAATKQGKLVKGTIKATNEVPAERLPIE